MGQVDLDRLFTLLGNFYGPGFILYANMATYATIDTYANGCMRNWEVLLCAIAGLVVGVPMASLSSIILLFETQILLGFFGIVICTHAAFGLFGANAVVSIAACVMGLVGASVFGVNGKPSTDIPRTVSAVAIAGVVYHIISVATNFSPTYVGVSCNRDAAGTGVFFGALLHGISFAGYVRQYDWNYTMTTLGVAIAPICVHAYYPGSFIVPTMIHQAMDALHVGGLTLRESVAIACQFVLLVAGVIVSAYRFHWALKQERRVDPERTFTILFIAFSLSTYLLNHTMPVIVVFYSAIVGIMVLAILLYAFLFDYGQKAKQLTRNRPYRVVASDEQDF